MIQNKYIQQTQDTQFVTVNVHNMNTTDSHINRIYAPSFACVKPSFTFPAAVPFRSKILSLSHFESSHFICIDNFKGTLNGDMLMWIRYAKPSNAGLWWIPINQIVTYQGRDREWKEEKLWWKQMKPGYTVYKGCCCVCLCVICTENVWKKCLWMDWEYIAKLRYEFIYKDLCLFIFRLELYFTF
jgi:hypothetical protein